MGHDDHGKGGKGGKGGKDTTTATSPDDAQRIADGLRRVSELEATVRRMQHEMADVKDTMELLQGQVAELRAATSSPAEQSAWNCNRRGRWESGSSASRQCDQ